MAHERQTEFEERAVVVTETREGVFPQRVEIGPHVLRADEPVSLGGTDSGPTPYELLAAALAACTSMTLRLYANRRNWPLQGIRIRVKHDKVHAKDCADCETREGRIDVIEREITLEGPLDEQQRARLLEIADRCPVHRTLEGEIKVRTQLR